MLASLLPGIRELRAPLAAGYVWLAALWFGWLAGIRPVELGDGLVADGYRLGQLLGHAGVLAVVSFVAYIVGVFSSAVTRGIIRVGNFIHYTKLSPVSPGHWRVKQIQEEVPALVVSRLSERYMADGAFRSQVLDQLVQLRQEVVARKIPPSRQPPDIGDVLEEALREPSYRAFIIRGLVDLPKYVDETFDDFWHMGNRLLGKDEAVYMEYDRLRSEGRFRTALALPLGCLFLVLAFRFDAIWLAGLAGAVGLLYLGVGSLGEADELLIGLLAAKRVDSPVLERLASAEVHFAPVQELSMRTLEELNTSE